MRVLFGLLIGTAIGTIVFGDNLERLIKVSTMQVDTVYSTYTTKIEIDIDTVRTYRKDKLVVITGIGQNTVGYNVKKSEWIDSILLTKPKSYRIDKIGYEHKVWILYNDFYVTKYSWNDYVDIDTYNKKSILIDGVMLKHKISNQTMKNLKTVVSRYEYILTH